MVPVASPLRSSKSCSTSRPRNRAEVAVERTAPLTLFLYTLVVLWYVTTGYKLRSAQPPKLRDWKTQVRRLLACLDTAA